MPSLDPTQAVHSRNRRRWLPVVLTAGLAALGVTFGYVALHPTRLMAQAHQMAETHPFSYIHDGDGSREFLLDNSRRIRLTFEAEKRPDDDAANPPPQQPPRSASSPNGILTLRSDAAPQIDSPRIGAFPLGYDTIVGVLPDHSVFGARLSEATAEPTGVTLTRRVAGKPQMVRLVKFGILENATPAAPFTATVPCAGTVNALVVSPQGDRLIWVMHSVRQPYKPLLWAVKKWNALDRFAGPKLAVSVWTTDIHGGHPNRVGEEIQQHKSLAATNSSLTEHAGADPDEEGLFGAFPEMFSWSPDGKSIRFHYDTESYEITVSGS